MELIDNIPMLLTILVLALGILQCFCGYRIFKFILAITGFIVGSGIFSSIAFELSNSSIVVWIAGLIGGIIGAALTSTLYLFGVFVLGAFLGVVTGFVAFELFQKEPILLAVIILAIAFGLAALVYQKIMIIVATAFSGAWYIIIATALMLSLDDDRYIYPAVLVWLVLGSIGAAAQFKAYRKTL